MNPRRIADLLRERARLDLELADAFEDDATPANDAPPARPARRRRRSPVVVPTGKVKPTQIDRARADSLVRRHYGGG